MGQGVNLILGSGAARGLAHIGVIKTLEERGYEIKSVVGCSIGALVGGFYAAGRLDEYSEWVKALTELDTLRFLDISLTARSGMMKGDRLMQRLENVIGSHRIESLPIPFTAVATDLQKRREVWIAEGNLFDAIRASIAIPGIFTPHKLGERMLVDGGLLNPLPVMPPMHGGSDLTIAVSLSGARREGLVTAHESEALKPASQRVRENIERFLDQAKETLGLEDAQGRERHASLSDVLLGSFDTMQSAITRYRLAAYPPDILIEIPENVCLPFEFYKAAQLIESGRFYAHEALERV